MKVLIINGPNLNMLGIREPDIYGKTSYSELCSMLETWCRELSFESDIKQSNHEGVIIDWLQEAYFNNTDGIIINPGAYTHYSYAIRDCLAILKMPIYEVHISDIHSREDFRNISVIEPVITEQISGLGLEGYKTALIRLKKALTMKKNS